MMKVTGIVVAGALFAGAALGIGIYKGVEYAKKQKDEGLDKDTKETLKNFANDVAAKCTDKMSDIRDGLAEFAATVQKKSEELKKAIAEAEAQCKTNCCDECDGDCENCPCDFCGSESCGDDCEDECDGWADIAKDIDSINNAASDLFDDSALEDVEGLSDMDEMECDDCEGAPGTADVCGGCARAAACQSQMEELTARTNEEDKGTDVVPPDEATDTKGDEKSEEGKK